MQKNHLTSITGIGEKRTLTCKLPDGYNRCTHAPIPTYRPKIGCGSFGNVYAMDDWTCAKMFYDAESFYQELMMSDLISLAKDYREESETRHRALMKMLGACVPCRVIFFPRYHFNLSKFQNWCPENIQNIVNGFEGLYNALWFLNEKCGIFHSDVSPCNILVEIGARRGALGRLVLADVGISTPHEGNNFNKCILKSSRGRPLFEVGSVRDPYDICKDAYKPACLLARCHALKVQRLEGDLQDGLFSVSKKLALVIDTASLGYTLLFAIEKLIDYFEKDFMMEFYYKLGVEHNNPLYYLQFLVPKVVYCRLLSRLWNVKLDLGINMKGECSSTKLYPEHVSTFALWVEQFKDFLEKSLLSNITDRLKNTQLAHITCKLLAQDYFNENANNASRETDL